MKSTAEKPSPACVLMGPPADTAWIRYLTGFEAPDPVLALVTRRGVDLLVSPLEAGRAGACAAVRRNVRVHTAETLGLDPGEKRRPYSAFQRLLHLRGIRSVRISTRYPAHAARCLEEAGVSVHVDPGVLVPGREVKSDTEIRHIRRAQQAAVRAMREAIAMIAAARIDGKGWLRHGTGRLTAEAVRTRIAQVVLEAGCREEGTIVACGRQAADPHERGRGPLRAGEAIVLDIFPRHVESGYWGDLTRTVVRGRVRDRLVRMYAAVHAAQAAALSRMAPRVSFGSVHAAAQTELERRGYQTTLGAPTPEGFIHGTGHGVGLELHEAPALRAGGSGRLKIGHVVTVEPGLYYRGEGGIRIEDTVVVTERGARILAPMARTFQLDS